MINMVKDSDISGIKIFTPEIHEDDRGIFFESYNIDDFRNFGLTKKFVQDNQAYSVKNTLRGLHYQLKYQQGKLVRVIQGEVFDVAVDIRLGSPTFGKHTWVYLSDKNYKIMYLPEGFAHGYLVLSKTAIFQYKCTAVYHPEHEYGLIWNDDELKIEWPIQQPLLSEKDKNLPTLKSINQKYLPKY